MKKLVVIAVLAAGVAGIAYYTGLFTDTPATEGTAAGGQGRRVEQAAPDAAPLPAPVTERAA